MSKKVISYIISKSEESAANSLFYFLLEKEPRFAISNEISREIFEQNLKKEFFELNLKLFTDFQKYYIRSSPGFIKLEGFGPKKIDALESIFNRIMANTPVIHGDFFPEYYFSEAISRYESLRKRNFERILFEKFNIDVFLRAFPILAERREVDLGIARSSILDQKYSPTNSMFTHEFGPADQAKIAEIYTDMSRVRLRNSLMDTWLNAHTKTIKILESEYSDEWFEKALSFKHFSSFYGSNDNDRACEYCGVFESTIETLSQDAMINTKRFYSRGKSMEVDKRDPQKPYCNGNLVLSCYWCNNAKTDEFSFEEFKRIGEQISKIWQERLMKKSG